MDTHRNTELVKQAYAAFGRGDVQGILDTLADDILWDPVKGCGPHVPTAGERRGKAAVGEFFRVLSESLTFEQFEPREFVAQGDTVAVVGRYRANVKRGTSFEVDWVMVFTIRNDRVAVFREFTDSAAINAAFERAAV